MHSLGGLSWAIVERV